MKAIVMVCICPCLFAVRCKSRDGGQLSTQSRSLARLSLLLGQRQWDKQALGKPDSLKSGYHLFYWHPIALITKMSWNSLLGHAVRSPLCPPHCISTHSLHCSLGLLAPPLFEGFFSPLLLFLSHKKRERKMMGDLRKGSI